MTHHDGNNEIGSAQLFLELVHNDVKNLPGSKWHDDGRVLPADINSTKQSSWLTSQTQAKSNWVKHAIVPAAADMHKWREPSIFNNPRREEYKSHVAYTTIVYPSMISHKSKQKVHQVYFSEQSYPLYEKVTISSPQPRWSQSSFTSSNRRIQGSLIGIQFRSGLVKKLLMEGIISGALFRTNFLRECSAYFSPSVKLSRTPAALFSLFTLSQPP